MAPTVKEILADPRTPEWIREGVERIRRDDPLFAVFLEAIHDYRVEARPRRG